MLKHAPRFRRLATASEIAAQGRSHPRKPAASGALVPSVKDAGSAPAALGRKFRAAGRICQALSALLCSGRGENTNPAQTANTCHRMAKRKTLQP